MNAITASRTVESSLRDIETSRGAVPSVASRLGNGTHWIYGAGGFGRRLARLLTEMGGRVAGFIDQAKPGAELDGLVVMAPDHFTPGNTDTLLIGLYNPAHSWAGPMAWARAKGFRDVLTPVDLVEVLPSLATFWLAPKTKLREHLPALLGVADLLADAASIKVLEQILAFRLTGNPLLHPAVQATDQYLPQDFKDTDLAFPEPISFLDGGAYNGDTGLFLASQGVQLREWVAFEPDLANFRDLVKNAAALPQTRRSFYPLGLGDSVTDLCFDAQGQASSRFGEAGASVVRCVSIDGALAGFRPDYVKLDIEGAEDAALQGMAGTLSNARPHLAVSIYHNPDDLFVLTDRVYKILPEARLYLRQHAESGFDTVLYAFT